MIDAIDRVTGESEQLLLYLCVCGSRGHFTANTKTAFRKGRTQREGIFPDRDVGIKVEDVRQLDRAILEVS